MARRTEIPPGEVITIAMAGNPNVGKSTLFNAVTGLNQHTGNWPGKTVASAEGLCRHGGKAYRLVDLPGTYSLLAHSAEEEVARNFLCFSRPEAVCIVCDATCLERNLNLVLQTLEITPRAAICLNLMDEAKKRKLRIEPARLEALLGVPVMGCTARQKNTPARLFSLLERATGSQKAARSYMPRYPEEIEKALVPVCRVLQKKDCRGLAPRWVALRLLEGDPTLMEELDRHLGPDFRRDAGLFIAMTEAERLLAEGGIPQGELPDRIVATLAGEASRLAAAVVTGEEKSYSTADRRLDKVLTGRRWGIPIMLGLLAVIFWLTISGANLPSALLAKGLFRLQDLLSGALLGLGVPLWLHDALILGVYRVAAWVVSVMLPHHRFAAGTAAGHPDQQLCPLQRAVPHAGQSYPALFCGNGGGAGTIGSFGAAADRIYPAGGGGHLCGDRAPFPDGAAGRAFLLYAGAAALPAAPMEAGHRPLGL